MTFGLRVVAKLLLLLTSFAMYGALGALHARGGPLTSMAIAALLVFVAILFHELAHAAAARLVGARVHAIVALPVRLRFRPLRLDLIGRGGRGDLGGYVTFTLDRIAARRKHAIIAAAGPLANVLLAIAAGALAAKVHHPVWPILFFAFTVLSGGLGLANLIPYDGSDGAQLLRLWRQQARFR